MIHAIDDVVVQIIGSKYVNFIVVSSIPAVDGFRERYQLVREDNPNGEQTGAYADDLAKPPIITNKDKYISWLEEENSILTDKLERSKRYCKSLEEEWLNK